MKPANSQRPARANRAKFIIGGLVIVAAVVYLIVSATQTSAQYYVTIDEMVARKAEIASRDLRISGAVIGDTIKYDSKNLVLSFTVANIPNDNKLIEDGGGLANVLHAAVENKNANRLNVVYKGVRPDLLKNEAQAIMTGKLGADGTFYASELLLKCPSRYEEALPEQTSK